MFNFVRFVHCFMCLTSNKPSVNQSNLSLFLPLTKGHINKTTKSEPTCIVQPQHENSWRRPLGKWRQCLDQTWDEQTHVEMFDSLTPGRPESHFFLSANSFLESVFRSVVFQNSSLALISVQLISGFVIFVWFLFILLFTHGNSKLLSSQCFHFSLCALKNDRNWWYSQTLCVDY